MKTLVLALVLSVIGGVATAAEMNRENVSCTIPITNPKAKWNNSAGWIERIRFFTDRTANWISASPMVTGPLDYCKAIPANVKNIYVSTVTFKVPANTE